MEGEVERVGVHLVPMVSMVSMVSMMSQVKYGKYKPLTAPAKCVECLQKAVKTAYHIRSGPASWSPSSPNSSPSKAQVRPLCQ